MLIKIFCLLIVLFLTTLFLGFLYGKFYLASKEYTESKNEFINQGKFFVPDLPTQNKEFKDFIRWRFGGGNKVAWEEPYTREKINYQNQKDPSLVRATFINHATVLLESKDTAILTDPIFTERASPFSFLGPKRHHDPYLSLSDIPKVDVVVISHNHYDHLSLPTLQLIEERFKLEYIVPLNNSQFLQQIGIPKERITELNLFESTEKKGAKVTLEKAQHWSARGIGDRNRSLWGSYMIEMNDKKIFFAGDTGYNKHFAEIKERYQKIDLALLPIGAYEPRWFMKEHHINQEDALQSARDLGSLHVMGIHFGTFKLTDEGRYDPEEGMKELLQKQNYPETFLIPTIKNGLVLEI